MRILLVDDEEIVRISLHDDLNDAGHDVTTAADGMTALGLLGDRDYDVVVTDLRMPGVSGMDLLTTVLRDHPGTKVILITAFATVEGAVEAMKAGAYDYVVKPFDVDRLLVVLDRLQENEALSEENRRLKAELVERRRFDRIIGKSSEMQRVYRSLELVCARESTVLLCGDTGTGKELVAEAIHYNGSRKSKPLIKVSCAALSRDVLESELFGHVRGAFTGAVQDRRGRFELAHEGTLFLDEVDDIPTDLQVKLLRVLESQEFERVGDEVTRKVDVRLIAATKVDLQELVARRRFRDDLYYRLNVLPISLPKLSDRAEDIPLLVESFLNEAEDDGPEFSPEALDVLMSYNWPGNVRELRNVVDRMKMLCQGGTVRVRDLPDEIKGHAPDPSEPASRSFDEVVAALERRLLLEALEKSGGNKTQAARILQMTPSTFRYKLASHFETDPT